MVTSHKLEGGVLYAYHWDDRIHGSEVLCNAVYRRIPVSGAAGAWRPLTVRK